jgi:hypothetical protein
VTRTVDSLSNNGGEQRFAGDWSRNHLASSHDLPRPCFAVSCMGVIKGLDVVRRHDTFKMIRQEERRCATRLDGACRKDRHARGEQVSAENLFKSIGDR